MSTVWTVELWNDGDLGCEGVEPTEALAWELVARRANEEFDRIFSTLDRSATVKFAGRRDERAAGWREEIARRHAKEKAGNARVRAWEIAL